MGWVVTYKNERETSNYDKREMILIYHLAIYYYRSGCSRLSWHRGRKVEKSRRIAKGRQVITLNLAITLRVSLVRDFVKSLLTLYIYIIFKRLFLYKIGYRVPFKHDYFYINDWFTFYIYYPGGGGSSWIVWHTGTIFWLKRVVVWKGCELLSLKLWGIYVILG